MSPIVISRSEITQQSSNQSWENMDGQERRWCVAKILRARGGSDYQIRMLELGNPAANNFVVTAN